VAGDYLHDRAAQKRRFNRAGGRNSRGPNQTQEARREILKCHSAARRWAGGKRPGVRVVTRPLERRGSAGVPSSRSSLKVKVIQSSYPGPDGELSV
jgi:hypothetical protein